jgi:peptidyl-prolyl cis-trans isomerase D
MLRFIRQGQRWLVTALVAAVGAVFVLFFGPWDFSQTAGSSEAPVIVDGRQFDRDDVARVRDTLERQYRDALGDQYEKMADNLQIEDRAVRQIVDRAILADEARRMGLAASEGEVDRLIRSYFSELRDAEGRIDEERARANVVYEWGSVRRFREAVRTDILLRKFGRVLLGTAGVSRSEALEALRYREEQVRIAFVSLDPENPPAELDIEPGDVEEFARNNYSRISVYYDENVARYLLPERIRLRHILVRVEPGEDEEAARERAEAIHARIAAGEDMAAVAREVSDDEGSRELGGDLGLLTLGEVSMTLRRAVEGLEDRELAPVVRGDQGFHIVRREERQPASTRPLEEVTPEIAEELLRAELGQTWATETADRLQALIDEGQSLEDAARALRLNIERTDFFSRRPDGYVPDLGDSFEVQTAAFAATESDPTWPHPFSLGDRTVFVQLLERRSPDPAELEARVEEQRQALEEEAQRRAEAVWLAERRTQLQDEGRIQIDPSALE